MSITRISSTLSPLSVQAPTSPSTQSPTVANDAAVGTGVTVDISKPGQLMSELTSLAQSDPDRFKTVTAQIAQQLRDAASAQSR